LRATEKHNAAQLCDNGATKRTCPVRIGRQSREDDIVSFSNMLGQMLQQGLSGQSGQRMNAGMASMQGGGLESVFGSLMGKAGGGAGGGMDLASMAKQFLGQQQAGGMTGGQLGGLGALAGALLGGGGSSVRGALGGGALAMLGTLAIKALQNTRQGQAPAVSETEAEVMTSEATAELVLRAMVAAAQADGTIDKAEMTKIMGEAGKDGVTDAERQLVMDAMTQLADPQALALAVPSQPVAAQVYAASLMAITVDTEQERQYLRNLAQALGLDASTVQALHHSVGAPVA
jgi:uncharacterized membrane protein YebE (DUF533 family)